MPALLTSKTLWAIVAAAALLACVWFYRGDTVATERNEYWQGVVAKADSAAKGAKIDADAKVTKASREAQASVDAINTRLVGALGDLDVANRTVSSLRAALAAGGGVRVSVARSDVCGPAAIHGAGPAGGDRVTVHAQLPAETADDLDRLAADADATAYRHNACVAAYNAVRDQLKELSNDRDRVPAVLGGSSATAGQPSP